MWRSSVRRRCWQGWAKSAGRGRRVRRCVPVGSSFEGTRRCFERQCELPRDGRDAAFDVTTVETQGVLIAADGGDAGLRGLAAPVIERRLGQHGHVAGPKSPAPSSRGGGVEDEWRTLRLVRRSRTAAVWLTVGIATVSFVLSFTSLRNLAAMSAWPGWPSWLWPLILDGLIILATSGIVALAPYRDQFWNRVFLWAVLGVAALVSVGGNGLHAWLSTAQVVSWMRWGSAGLACIPPVGLLATTHILGTLWRFDPVPTPDARSQLRDRALELAAERMDRWEAAAAKLHEEGYCPSVPSEKIAGVLRYLYDCRPALSLRAIGAKPEVGLHHDTVGKIRDAAAAALGVGN
jgi:hypothetical protein